MRKAKSTEEQLNEERAFELLRSLVNMARNGDRPSLAYTKALAELRETLKRAPKIAAVLVQAVH